MLEFLVRNWGNLASVAGLGFSILAFVFAKRASTAARDAQDAAMRQSLGEDMNGAARIASEIVTYLRINRGDMALLRIGDLMDRTSYLAARWEARLPKRSRDNLSRAHEQLRSTQDVLSGNTGATARPEDKARLVRATQQISEILSEEHGTAVKSAEARDK